MAQYKCEFCLATFCSQSNLNQHKKFAKYCLERRGVATFQATCSCGKKFSDKTRFTSHQKICLRSVRQQLETVTEECEQYKAQIKILQEKLSETKNTNVLTDGYITGCLDKINYQTILRGPK